MVHIVSEFRYLLSMHVHETSSPKGNNRSPDNKLSKYFEQFSSKKSINWSRAANSAVHGWIRPKSILF